MGNIVAKIRGLVLTTQYLLGLSPLDRWRSKFEFSLKPRLWPLYRWSPEETELLERAWSEYHELDLARQEQSRPPLVWQGPYSQERESYVQSRELRRLLYSPMSYDKDSMKVAPLSVYMHRFLDTPMERQVGDRIYSWKAALSNWNTFNVVTASDPEFILGLSAAQKSALRILDEWWNSSYSDPVLIEVTQKFIRSQEHVECYASPLSEGGQPRLDQAVAKEILADTSLYHFDCFRLFCLEFHPQCWEPYESALQLALLQRHRQLANFTAIAQRFACSVVNPEQCTAGIPYIPPVRADNSW